MRIKAIVLTQNGDKYYVMDDIPVAVSHMYGDKAFIIRRYGKLFDFLVYKYDKFAKAFAGREIEVPLDDGTTFKCKDVWWDFVPSQAKDILKNEGREGNIIRIAASCDREMMESYVFYGMYALDKEIEEMEAEYDGPTYGYWDYEKLVIKPLREERKEAYHRSLKDKIISSGFRQTKKGRYESMDGLILDMTDSNWGGGSMFSKTITCYHASKEDVWLLNKTFGDTMRWCEIIRGRLFIQNDHCINFFVWRK